MVSGDFLRLSLFAKMGIWWNLWKALSAFDHICFVCLKQNKNNRSVDKIVKNRDVFLRDKNHFKLMEQLWCWAVCRSVLLTGTGCTVWRISITWRAVYRTLTFFEMAVALTAYLMTALFVVRNGLLSKLAGTAWDASSDVMIIEIKIFLWKWSKCDSIPIPYRPRGTDDRCRRSQNRLYTPWVQSCQMWRSL